MLQKNTTAEKNKPELQGLWTINSNNNNKKLYGFSGSEENMVQKLAQTSLEKETSKFNWIFSFILFSRAAATSAVWCLSFRQIKKTRVIKRKQKRNEAEKCMLRN